ncbi:hypothetical protein D477_011736 [Arthrobacter crystallopoietes BAB-32]|uniref:Integral membrane protein n=1 Tax=Arthrobacter crystallopoietes BAB-32 TaxID=1246476 RepID=N1UY90_9MICC|nr:DUF1772 domain-containing protein [Arthrobacter crystallopoietes]EMY34035.1 hypothetical protein D477_011736 [Arthrobacter crystallopoietes BAB-32]
MTVFFGTAVASTAVGVGGLAAADAPGLVRAGGAALYLSGFLLTMAYNVPLNNKLAALPAAEAAARWPQWERQWTRSNTTRALASVVGAALMVTAR